MADRQLKRLPKTKMSSKLCIRLFEVLDKS